MTSRDIWSKGGGDKIQDLLGSLLATLHLGLQKANPFYLCSPYLSDFRLLENRFGQFGALFGQSPELIDKETLLFSEMIGSLSRRMPVRIVTVQHSASAAFVDKMRSLNEPGLVVRIAPDIYHEKGCLCDDFYIEGSMNFTYSGVYVKDEKVTCHVASDESGRRKIDAAFLEFDRLWARLATQAGEGSQR